MNIWKYKGDHSGFIDANELQDCFKKMGQNYSKEQIKRMIKTIGNFIFSI